MWQENSSPQSQVSQSVGWKRLWNLKVPVKVKYFMWRFCRNNVPVRVLLQKRSANIPLCCPMCNVDVEHLLHVFFDYGFASNCWHEMGLQFNMWEVENAHSWLLERLSTDSYESLSKVAMTLWGIWFFQNKKVLENKVVTSQFAMNWSMKQLEEWRAAHVKVNLKQSAQGITKQKPRTKWGTPAAGAFKLNVDVAVTQGDASFAVGTHGPSGSTGRHYWRESNGIWERSLCP